MPYATQCLRHFYIFSNDKRENAAGNIDKPPVSANDKGAEPLLIYVNIYHHGDTGHGQIACTVSNALFCVLVSTVLSNSRKKLDEYQISQNTTRKHAHPLKWILLRYVSLPGHGLLLNQMHYEIKKGKFHSLLFHKTKTYFLPPFFKARRERSGPAYEVSSSILYPWQSNSVWLITLITCLLVWQRNLYVLASLGSGIFKCWNPRWRIYSVSAILETLETSRDHPCCVCSTQAGPLPLWVTFKNFNDLFTSYTMKASIFLVSLSNYCNTQL